MIAFSALVVGALTLVHTLHVRTTERMDREQKSRLASQPVRTPEPGELEARLPVAVRTFDRLPTTSL